MSSTSIMAEKRHELLSGVEAHVALKLQELGIEKEAAEELGIEVANHLSDLWAGSTISIPKDYQFKLTARDLEILGKFNGRNHHALALEYKLTENAVYRLLKRIQDRKFDYSQHKLPL